ncbi:MAG: MFS transporter [Planctomycetota bacterium]
MTRDPQAASPPVKSRWPSGLPGTVIVLGTASLLTDLSSEMIYPLLPVFIASTLGAGALALGTIEGVAEATASLTRVVAGRWADRAVRRKPFVVFGYTLSGLARPLIGLAMAWPIVLFLRFADRIGKGVRGAPRDALIADVTPAPLRGAAYGLQRAMDHAGAILGPLAAAALLTIPGMAMRSVFLLTAIPACFVVIVLVTGVRETPRARVEARKVTFLEDLPNLPRDFRRLLVAIAIFTLGNSTDAFLLWRLGHVGFAPQSVTLLWAGHHVVKMTASAVAGRLSDRFGRRPLVIAGWLVYAGVYAAFALVSGPAPLAVIFLVYGVCFGVTEPVEKAWIADLAPGHLRATAFGLASAAVGLLALPASLLFGIIVKWVAAPYAFGTGALLALVAIAFLLRVRGGAR